MPLQGQAHTSLHNDELSCPRLFVCDQTESAAQPGEGRVNL